MNQEEIKKMRKELKCFDFTVFPRITDMETIMVMEFDDSDTASRAMRGCDPLFYTRITLYDTVPLPSSEIKN